MKKFFVLFALLFFVKNSVYSATTVDFIYINGSNNNTEQAHEHFLKGINKFHPELKKRLEKDDFTYKHMLKNGDYIISDKPSNYFWGFKSQQALLMMQSNAKLLQSISPWLAYGARNLIANIMHDAICVTKEHNLIPILTELDQQVKADIQEGKKVILLGYSAGTFITLEYIGRKVAYINISDWFDEHHIDSDLKAMMNKHPKKDTCMTAFIGSGLTIVTPLGKIMPNPNKTDFKNAYMSMDKYTNQYCIPKDSVIGVINYASPIPLFYSDLADNKTDSTAFLQMMYKYLIEQDFFFLTVNFSDDPLGFPNDVNYKNSELEIFLQTEFNNPKGFFYDYAKTISLRTVIGAHTSYWSAKKRFANSIVKGYTEGYKFQYGDDTKK